MADLIHADTEQQRKLAIKQMDGGLFKQFDKWRNQVIKGGFQLLDLIIMELKSHMTC